MGEYKRNLLVGAFVLLGLGVLATLMVSFGELPTWLGNREYKIAVHLRWLAGVDEGTPVHMNGVQVGRVADFRFVDLERPDKGVYVDAMISSSYQIPNTATARIKPAGLGIGRGHVDIVLTPNVEAEPFPRDGTAVMFGEMGAPFDDIVPPDMIDDLHRTVTQVGNFADELTPVARDLHELFQRRTVEEVDAPSGVRQATANISTVIERFDQTMKQVNDIIGDPQVKSGLTSAVANVVDASADLKTTLADLRVFAANLKTDEQRVAEKMGGVLDDFRSTAQAAMPVLTTASRVATNLETSSRDLAEGKGTIGLMLRDPRLYEAINLTFTRLTDLIDTLRRITSGWEKKGYVDLAVHETAAGTVKVSKPIGN